MVITIICINMIITTNISYKTTSNTTTNTTISNSTTDLFCPFHNLLIIPLHDLPEHVKTHPHMNIYKRINKNLPSILSFFQWKHILSECQNKSLIHSCNLYRKTWTRTHITFFQRLHDLFNVTKPGDYVYNAHISRWRAWVKLRRARQGMYGECGRISILESFN